MNHKKPRVAASSYLNSAPLIWSFSNGSQKQLVELTDPVPSRCADLLANDSVDFALIPVIEYQRINGAQLIPDVCVGSRSRVRSVLLASRLNKLTEIKSVALDESSRTSAALIKIIFREFLGIEPEWTTSSPNIKEMLRQNDAALIIGDPGMSFARDHLQTWDLATLWREHTGHGFVFAMWATKGQTEAQIDFAAARDEGLHRKEEIVSEYVRKIGMPAAEIRDYLNESIVFQVDEDLSTGMNLYFELAFKHRQIDELKPIQFAMAAAGVE